jgi:ATP phosphoribosyltransferase
LEQLRFRIRSVKAASENKYILLNAPKARVEDIIRILPGMRSPSVLPLADSDWVSVHSVVEQADLWAVLDELRALGAEGILVLSIDQMIR